MEKCNHLYEIVYVTKTMNNDIDVFMKCYECGDTKDKLIKRSNLICDKHNAIKYEYTLCRENGSIISNECDDCQKEK